MRNIMNRIKGVQDSWIIFGKESPDDAASAASKELLKFVSMVA